MLYDEFYMRRAIRLAKKGEGKTSPNPMVGCVIVKDKKIIAEGYHKKAGLPHAEIDALQKAGNAKGATMYVTLEPCNHYGKTPPCTDEIIKRGIKKVIVAIKDPNKLNNGKGIRKLNKNKIQVKLGICKDEANMLYSPYRKFITEKVPFVTVKIAESLDGKIATSRGESKWISNEMSRSYVQKLRNRVDAVMVGINTVLKDDPLLLPRSKNKKNIKRIVLDSNLKIPINSRLLKSARPSPLIIATTMKPTNKKKNLLARKGAIIISISTKKKRIDLRKLFNMLAARGIMHILVEGGGELIGNLFDERLADKIVFFIAPKIIGGEAAISAIRGKGINKIEDAILLKNIEVKRLREDIVVEGDVHWDN